MWIVVTDLDGTLLNHGDYSWEGARFALEELETRGVPVIFCTSKTRAEVEVLRRETGNKHPFITENGGAVFLPAASFAPLAGELPRMGDFLYIPLGTAYEVLVETLADTARETGCVVRGFADASPEEVAAWCDFSVEEARLARQRDFDEPFVIVSGDGHELAAAIAHRGLTTTRGGRFWHILGKNDKGAALWKLRSVYTRLGLAVNVVALGDSANDLPLLSQAEIPVILPGPAAELLRQSVPEAIIARQPGSQGWSDVMRHLLRERLSDPTQSGLPW